LDAADASGAPQAGVAIITDNNLKTLTHLYQFLTKSPQKQAFFTYKPYLNRV